MQNHDRKHQIERKRYGRDQGISKYITDDYLKYDMKYSNMVIRQYNTITGFLFNSGSGK